MKRFVAVMVLTAAAAASAFAQGGKMSDPDAMTMEKAGKVDFTTIEDAMMSAGEGPTVLFFYASWCPTCRQAMKELDARPADLGDVTVVVVNYDKESALKKRYGVTYQHTFVQIDGAGEQIALWSGGGVDEILENVVHDAPGAMN